MAIDMFERSITLGDKVSLGRGSQIHEILRNNVNRLKNSIKNILDISKLESGMEPLKLSDISIADLVKHIVSEKEILPVQKTLSSRTNYLPVFPLLRQIGI